jgi:glucose-1-phosphatase
MAGAAGDGEDGECPPADTVYAYANSLQRTVATAQFFITGAFPGCDVPVHHQPKMGTMDPTFNPVITDNSPEFREKALRRWSPSGRKCS